MDEKSIATCVVDFARAVHAKSGPGRPVLTYIERLADVLAGSGLTVEPEESILFQFGGKRFNRSLRPPLRVGGTVLVESKSLSSLSGMHRKQMLTYLKLSNLSCGLLINFGRQVPFTLLWKEHSSSSSICRLVRADNTLSRRELLPSV